MNTKSRRLRDGAERQCIQRRHTVRADRLRTAKQVEFVDQVSGRFLHLYFVDQRPDAVWDATFAGLGAAYEKAGATVAFVSPFIPTIPGTDTYTDQLW